MFYLPQCIATTGNYERQIVLLQAEGERSITDAPPGPQKKEKTEAPHLPKVVTGNLSLRSRQTLTVAWHTITALVATNYRKNGK
jgi:hypothetical protein